MGGVEGTHHTGPLTKKFGQYPDVGGRPIHVKPRMVRIDAGPRMSRQDKQALLHIRCKRIQNGVCAALDRSYAFHGRMDQQRPLAVDSQLLQLLYQALFRMHVLPLFAPLWANVSITYCSLLSIRCINSSAALYPSCLRYQLFAAASINPATSRPGWSWISRCGI
ncbi:hypothetical protein D1872_238840 [compost metagenome]